MLSSDIEAATAEIASATPTHVWRVKGYTTVYRESFGKGFPREK